MPLQSTMKAIIFVNTRKIQLTTDKVLALITINLTISSEGASPLMAC
jgi:hypothetical protein